ncbi:winged helix DNA-binding domain-containing protein [Streptomyces cinerochromogenes]|uniref:winged helix DNA-binding domain-containing protein n=1 Tax=Streptomyces cinerochromogenes TaxID=66422 RepID=UPI0033A401AF
MTKSSGKQSSSRSGAGSAPVMDERALNRATLARQLLLCRSPRSVPDAVRHLLGLQAQNTRPPYYALAARLDGFAPERLSALMAGRDVARIVTLRSTIHTHTADDCLTLRPFVQSARDRELGYFRAGLAGVDPDRLAAVARELVEAEPRTMAQLREALGAVWPDADPRALAVAARCLLPLVQVTPRGLWEESGQVALTTIEHWLGRPAEPAPAPDAVVPRYLAAFGPASVRDMQTWCGLTRLKPAFERLRPGLLTFRDPNGVELFDHRGRHWRGNQAYRTLLVDGFLAGLWKLDGDTLVIETFERPTRAQREEVTAEGERMLAVMHPGAAYDIRFGEVVRS